MQLLSFPQAQRKGPGWSRDRWDMSDGLTCCLSSGARLACHPSLSGSSVLGQVSGRECMKKQPQGFLGAGIQRPAYGEPGEGHGYCIQGWNQQAGLLVSSCPTQGCAELRDKLPG